LRTFIENLEYLYLRLFSKKKKYSGDTAHFKSIIYNYEIVTKYDFYGYHEKKENFLKIYVYEPKFIKQLSKILESTAIMDIQF